MCVTHICVIRSSIFPSWLTNMHIILGASKTVSSWTLLKLFRKEVLIPVGSVEHVSLEIPVTLILPVNEANFKPLKNWLWRKAEYYNWASDLKV